MKTYVAVVEELKKKERQDGFLSFIPRWMLMYFFVVCFWISPCVWPNLGFWCCVFLTLRITLLLLLQKMCNLFTLSGSKRGRAPNSPSTPPPALNSSCSINPIEHAPYILHTLHTYQVIRRWECNTRVQNCALPACKQIHLCRLLLLLCRERTSHSHALVSDHKTHKRESGGVRSREAD